MSLRKKSARDGNGPAVSFGDTTHALAVPLVAPPVVVGVVVDVVVVGLVGVWPPHPRAMAAPAAPRVESARRRFIGVLKCSSFLVPDIVTVLYVERFRV
jgi:hypothetical protein